jgi:predicted ATPase/class 3 adenylate cyclase/DNA-binding CsgD family transcriptional regulator
LPSGVVTFLLTDIVGSTRLWENVPAEMDRALARHGAIVADAIAANGGRLLRARGEGDSTFSVFALASDAVAAAYAAQVDIEAEAWPPGARLSVRFAVHTGESVERDGDYLGPAVNRAARIRAVAHGGEVLVSESTAQLVADRLPTGVRLLELGQLPLRDLDRPEPTYVLAGPGLPAPSTDPSRCRSVVEEALVEHGVTRKEAEVLDALGQRLTNAEIASRLYVSVRTVESHVSSLLRKFQVASRHDLALVAAPSGSTQSPAPAPPRPDNLSTPVSPLVDREVELARILSLLGDHRLVTLVGPGGTGKTRLAIHVAAHKGGLDLGDAWCAEFTAVRSQHDIAEVIVAALGALVTSDTDPVERVARALSMRSGLLVLDNCEHVRTHVGSICVRILEAAPNVRLLATSREPLGVDGEALLPVPPLSTPGDDAFATVAASDAVRLFLDRARAYKPDFSLGPDNAAAVAELCRSLDGLPLAIELAAARVTTMTPSEIVARLDQLFRILGHRSRDVDHHQTLHATLDWSYQLLDSDEQALLAQLAAFAPGFSLAAVEAVHQGSFQQRHVIDVLTGLVDKSMVVAETKAGMTRLRLLETVRAYGLEKADEAGGQADLRRRHLAFYTRLAEELAGPTVVADVDSRSTQLAADAPNIRLALDYAVDSNDAEATFDLTAAIVDVWCLSGWGGAVLSALEATLDRPDIDPDACAEAYATAAWSAFSQGRHSKALSCCDASERCSGSIGRPPIARALYVRGLLRLLDDGDIPAGMSLCEEALERVRQSGYLRRYAHDLASYGAYLAVVGDRARCPTVSAESVALARQLGDRHSLGIGLDALGYVSIEAEPARARAYFAEASEIGDPWCSGSALWGLGWLDDRAGDDGGALARYGKALELWSETGDWRGIYYAIQGIAIVATREGRLPTAVRLFAGAHGLGPDVGGASMPLWNEWRDHYLALLREALSSVEFSTGWLAGERLEPDVLVKEALIEARR